MHLQNNWIVCYRNFMKTASQEIRTKAIEAYNSGVSRKQIAEDLGYHLKTIDRWIRDYRKDGRLKALPRGHRVSMFTEAERERIISLIERKDFITLREIRHLLIKDCSLNAIHKLVKSLGFEFEKTPLREKKRDYEDIVYAQQNRKLNPRSEASVPAENFGRVLDKWQDGELV